MEYIAVYACVVSKESVRTNRPISCTAARDSGDRESIAITCS